MTTQPLEQRTYLPPSDDGVAEVLSFIRAHAHARGERPTPRYFLAGAGEGDQIELPEAAYLALVQILEALNAGKAVTVAPQNQRLTTQQAADLLGVSRPTVIKLIDNGELHAETPGTRRRLIRLDDLLACKARRREAQYQALITMAVDDTDAEMNSEEVTETLRRVRADVAERRRNRSKG